MNHGAWNRSVFSSNIHGISQGQFPRICSLLCLLKWPFGEVSTLSLTLWHPPLFYSVCCLIFPFNFIKHSFLVCHSLGAHVGGRCCSSNIPPQMCNSRFGNKRNTIVCVFKSFSGAKWVWGHVLFPTMGPFSYFVLRPR